MILIIGSETEGHSKHIFDELTKRNIEVEYFNTLNFPGDITISYTPCCEGFIKIGNKKIMIDDVKGVYWRWHYGINYLKGVDNYLSSMVYRERKSALESFLYILKDKANLVNSIEAINLHKTKTYQLNLLLKNNVRIPKTLITNDIEALREFYEANDKNVIYKPVLGGAYTKKLTEENFKKESLQSLKASPIQLQEFIQGVDIRAYALNGNVFAGRIISDTIDFRESESGIECVNLPKKVQKDCLKILKILKLEYSGIDIRQTEKGEYVFIEANPAPMFVHFERTTNYPITENLIQLLVKEKA